MNKISRWALLLLVPLVVAGCDGDDPAGIDSGIAGNYNAEWTATLSAAGLGTYTLSCPGTLNVSSFTTSTFTGTFAVKAQGENCDDASGSFQGEIVGNQMTLTVNGNSLNQILEGAGCTIVTGTGVFSGTYSNRKISGDTQYTADCANSLGSFRVDAKLALVAQHV